MPDCEYCDESFEKEKSYLRHLRSEHEGELSRLDRRRVGEIESERSMPTGMIVIGLIILGGFLVTGYLVVIGGGTGSGDGPHGQTHEHGTLELIIDGEAVDFDQPHFIGNDPHFHFHGGDRVGTTTQYVFHVHAHGVTIQYALETLGMTVDDEGSRLTFDGETYRADEPGTEISITVDGEPVEPAEHELGGGTVTEARNGHGDTVRIEVTTDE